MNLRRNLWIVAIAITLSLSAFALADGLELKPYGFVKGDMLYVTGGVQSFGNYSLLAPQTISSDTLLENPAVGFTAQHTRFGLKGTTGEDLKAGGLVELDFFTGSGYNANASPRIRLAYASLAKGNWELRLGQQWDLFSPNNPLTNNTNGNMWYAGNMGFRRPQFQFAYSMPTERVVPMLQLAICEAAREADGVGADNRSGMPMIQGRLSAKCMKKYAVGAYFMHASFDPDANVDDNEFTASGFGADFNLPFHKLLALTGEVNMGTNLNNANLFTVAGSGAKDNDRKNMGIWVNAVSKPHANFNAVLGFGMDQNQTDDAKIATGAVEKNTMIYAGLIAPVNKFFSLALEVESITTSYKDGDDMSAIVLDIAGKVTF